MGVSPKKQKQTKRTVIVLDWAIAAIWLVIVYATGSLALDSGSWWHYGATAVAVGFTIRALRILIKRRYGR